MANTIKISKREIKSNPNEPNMTLLTKRILDALQLGASNFVLAYNIRAGIGVMLRIFKLLKSRKFRDLFCLSSLLGESHLNFRVDAVSLGLFVGWFTGGYKAILAVLRHYRKSEDESNSFLAGWCAAIAIIFLDKARRRTLALYMFVRALQCSYNGAKSRGMWHFWGSSWKHGDALLFALSSAQIMYAYVMRSNTLPQSYYKFIVSTGPVRHRALGFVKANNRGIPVPPKKVQDFLELSGSKFQYRHKDNFPPVIPCAVIHSSSKSCSVALWETFFRAARKTFPLYMSLHLVPTVVLRLKHFVASPFKALYRATLGAAQSTVFVGAFVSLYLASICQHRKICSRDSKLVYYVAGLVASSAIIIEPKSRRSELALYVLPRAADSLFMILKDRAFLSAFPFGDVFLFCFSMGTVMRFYQNESKNMSPTIQKILRRFLESPK